MVFVYCERLSNRVNRWFAMPKNSFQCQVIAMFKLVPYYRIYCNSNKLIRTHIHRQNQMSRISHTLLLNFISIPFNDGKYARITCILTSLPIDCICIGNIDPQTKIKPNACECVCDKKSKIIANYADCTITRLSRTAVGLVCVFAVVTEKKAHCQIFVHLRMRHKTGLKAIVSP